jgi:MFS transporter, MHS family, proline/betaine transporter
VEKIKQHTAIFRSSLGNILEWYDFGLFTIFSSLFSQLFFPAHDKDTALIYTLGIFAIGFLCRPIGGLLFGYLGDIKGRASTLRLSILMISLPTLLIGLLPTYKNVGIMAPILLILIRMWQGISLGGEFSGNLIYLAETAAPNHRGAITAFANSSANIGILLASLVGIVITYFYSEQVLLAWAWRLPYIISGIFSVILYLYRLSLPETDVFIYLKKQHQLTANPIKTIFKDKLFYLLRTLGLVCMGSTFYFFCFMYLPIFITDHLLFPERAISLLISGLIVSMIIFIPFAGFLSDQIGRRKMLLFNATFIIVITIPGFYFLQFNNAMMISSVLILFTLASSLEQGTTCVALVENFPSTARYTGISMGYNLGNGLLGGTVPLVCSFLFSYTHFILAPSLYITFCAAITGLTILFLVPETRGKSLLD